MAHSAKIDFQDKMFSYAPFIQDKIYSTPEEIRILCRDQVDDSEFMDTVAVIKNQPDEYSKRRDINFKTRRKHANFIGLLRGYLESLHIQQE